MKDRLIQQLDTPLGIYNKPHNRFVAGFIGSPGMNFISGQLISTDDQWQFKAEDLTLSLHGYEFNREPSQGMAVEFGIRPEHIVIGAAASSQPNQASVEIELVEPMGADTVVWSNLGGNSFTLRVDSEAAVNQNQMLPIGFSAARASLFQADDGLRL